MGRCSGSRSARLRRRVGAGLGACRPRSIGGAAGRDAERGERDQGAGAGEPGAASSERDSEVGGVFRGGARPPIEVIVEYIDAHRDEFGVEPICSVLQMAPSTYYAAKRREPAPSARAVRDAVMMQMLMVLWVTNRKVYGAHKLWKAARRAGHDIGRDQVARLMRAWRSRVSAARRKKVFTTRPTLTRCGPRTW